MNANKWETDTEGFRKALKENEYAEYTLNSRFSVVTDVDSPPYVVGKTENPKKACVEINDLLVEELPFLDIEVVLIDERNSESLIDGAYMFDIQ